MPQCQAFLSFGLKELSSAAKAESYLPYLGAESQHAQKGPVSFPEKPRTHILSERKYCLESFHPWNLQLCAAVCGKTLKLSTPLRECDGSIGARTPAGGNQALNLSTEIILNCS